jgi:hypothetical protein
MSSPRLLRAAFALVLALPTAPPIAHAAGSASATARRPAGTRHVVPFIADDLARARAEAKKTNRPIFVESWAPW